MKNKTDSPSDAQAPENNNESEGNLSRNSSDGEYQEQYLDLAYLNKLTKGNTVLMKKMIGLYLKQTPELLSALQSGIASKDWDKIYGAVHKMIPSFWMMGIDPSFESMARTMQEFASKKERINDISELAKKVDEACLLACKQLQKIESELK